MQRVEYYIPVMFIRGRGDEGLHRADVITKRDFEEGGGLGLMGPFNQMQGVTVDRAIPQDVQAQVARLSDNDPYAIVYHYPLSAPIVHAHFQKCGLNEDKNAIRLMRDPPKFVGTQNK